MKKMIITLCLFAANRGLAEVQYGYGLDLRSYPVSASASAFVNRTALVWDGRQDDQSFWKYGFYKIAAKAWAHGAVDGSVEVNPISFLQFGYLRSSTSRFYEIKPNDCLIVECRGVLVRDQLYANLALGYQDWIAQLGAGQVNYQITTSLSNFAVEGDGILGQTQNEKSNYSSVFIGKKSDEQVLGLFAKFTQMELTKQSVQQTYFLAQKKMDNNLKAFVGLGGFKSDAFAQGFSIIGGANWTFGESLALF